MGFFSGLFSGAKHYVGRAFDGITHTLGRALWHGASAIAPYLFPTFYEPSVVASRERAGRALSSGISRGIGFAFTGH
jgi:lysophospholipid acyltransferase (LPLAT)-like uncharacterized protein